MFRFYCTVCHRIKRVRVLPLIRNSQTGQHINSENMYQAVKPEHRIGVCRRHSKSLNSPKSVKKAKVS